ncbi:sensor histidine kinase [Polyangium jinanense]|uniref:histidine kinase n=1 Tax=Polyangium jinanense TaxID=2829994 RepID=A0A9X3X7Y3_9BACT|nr:HAMP domain-containing sensor histidine kinase [Polyangium jinanense]MDC3956184.1 HAMP domain-containing histidine kinase [Polyangium jinanense]MDC3982981.1 HAMP domain-containing histidine kinase [Polyangium jinanense]
MKAARRIEPSHEALAARLAEAQEENERLRRENERLAQERAAREAAAEEARLELGTFFALVAHQLKSPLLPLELSLTTIARALERGTSVPPDTFPRTMRQARRLGRLIDALLVDLPRIEDGSLRVAALSFDLREPVRRAVGEAKLMLESRTFALHEPAAPVRVRCDPERVEQIVTSLVENAVKYSPPEAPISVRVISEDATNATVVVEDRGIGIPARELGQVFTKFYRGSNAPSYLYRGLGVGLYLAHHLATLCRGRLSVESVEGQGTICRLCIPLEA